MRDREQVSRELDNIGNNSYNDKAAQFYIGKCIKIFSRYIIFNTQRTNRKE